MININGKEYGFLLTVGASVRISKICPKGDLARIEEALTGEYEKIIANTIEIVLALNAGFVASEEFMKRKANRLTENELMQMEPKAFQEAQIAALQAFKRDAKGEIKTKSTKKAKAEATA